MEPRIRYTKTSDGVNIAYAARRQRSALCRRCHDLGHLHMAQIGINDRGLLEYRGATDAWDARLRLRRASDGILDRAVADCSLQARVRDWSSGASAGARTFAFVRVSAHEAATRMPTRRDHPAEVEQLKSCADPFVSGADITQHGSRPAGCSRPCRKHGGGGVGLLRGAQLAFGVGFAFERSGQLHEKIAHAFRAVRCDQPTCLTSSARPLNQTNVAELLARIAVPDPGRARRLRGNRQRSSRGTCAAEYSGRTVRCERTASHRPRATFAYQPNRRPSDRMGLPEAWR